jgi:hypothetical protein
MNVAIIAAVANVDVIAVVFAFVSLLQCDVLSHCCDLILFTCKFSLSHSPSILTCVFICGLPDRTTHCCNHNISSRRAVVCVGIHHALRTLCSLLRKCI